MSQQKTYLNIDEAATLLKLKKSTIYQFTHMKKIPFIRMGSRLLFDLDDLNAWIASKKVQVRK